MTRRIRTEDDRCCNEDIFNRNSHICCDGTIGERNGKETSCCETTAFENDVQMCCNGVVNIRPNDKRQNHQCCFDIAFDKTVFDCDDHEGVLNPL